MGSIIGRRSEELEAINMNLKNILERLEELELRLSEEVRKSGAAELGDIKSSLEKLSQRVEALATTQPDYLVDRFLEGVAVLKSLVSYLSIFQEQQTELSRLLEFQKEQVDVLERARNAIIREREELEQERRNLEILKQELSSLKESVEEKEAALRGFESEVAALEEKKTELENSIKELKETYLATLQAASQQIDKVVKELDRKFKIREARLERLVRLEERKREEIAKIESAKTIWRSITSNSHNWPKRLGGWSVKGRSSSRISVSLSRSGASSRGLSRSSEEGYLGASPSPSRA